MEDGIVCGIVFGILFLDISIRLFLLVYSIITPYGNKCGLSEEIDKFITIITISTIAQAVGHFFYLVLNFLECCFSKCAECCCDCCEKCWKDCANETKKSNCFIVFFKLIVLNSLNLISICFSEDKGA